MKTLTCDLTAMDKLGNGTGTEAYIRKFLQPEYDFESAVVTVHADLYANAKTVPRRLARRLGSLVGVITTQIDDAYDREYLLDLVITAFDLEETKHES